MTHLSLVLCKYTRQKKLESDYKHINSIKLIQSMLQLIYLYFCFVPHFNSNTATVKRLYGLVTSATCFFFSYSIGRGQQRDKMSSGALFPSLVSGSRGSSSKYLVEFRAGKMSLKGNVVTPDKRKGTVYIQQSDDSLIHFCWKDRMTGNVDDVSYLEVKMNHCYLHGLMEIIFNQ